VAGAVEAAAAAAASGWLSDVDDPSRHRVDVSAPLSDGGDDRPSVGSSPRPTTSSSPDTAQQQRPPRPRVDYTAGLLALVIAKFCQILLLFF